MPAKTKPFDPATTDELVQLGRGRCAWTVRRKHGNPALVWAANQRQAAAILASKPGWVGLIVSVVRNYEAENMTPRPQTWSQFIGQGGGQ